MSIIKYDSNTASRLIELSGLGYNKTEISKMMRVSRVTLDRWIKKYDLKEAMSQAESDFMRNAIKRGLTALSEGAKTTESLREYTEEDEEGKIVRVTEKIRILAPSEKAIQILSKKYAKEFADAVHEEDKAAHLVLHVNPNAMSLREIQQLNASSNPLGAASIETECVTVSDSDSCPPRKDSESE